MNWRYCCAIAGMFFYHSAAAYDALIYVYGAVADNGCRVSINSQNMTVDFGNVSTKQFYSENIPWAKRKFVIDLESCGPAAKGVKVTFTGDADLVNPKLLAVKQEGDFATGVGVEFLDMNGVVIPLGVQLDSELLIDPALATNQLEFQAQYRSTGPVTTGAANATANFVLEYQ